MKSITMNQSAFQCDIFWALVRGLGIVARINPKTKEEVHVNGVVSPYTFSFQFKTWDGNQWVVKHEHQFTRKFAQLKSIEGDDIALAIENEFDKGWSDYVGKSNSKKPENTDKKQSSIGSCFYPPHVIPEYEEETKEYSEDVLIDVDGNRKHFMIGYYSVGDKVWKEKETADPFPNQKLILWTKLPLARD